MYNKWDLSYGTRNWSVPHNPEFQQKAARARKEKYGTSNAAMITKEAQEKARKTKIKKYGQAGPIISKEGKRKHDLKVSNKIIDLYTDKVLIGYKQVYELLNKEGYELTFLVCRRLVNGIFSIDDTNKYPELKNRFKVINQKKRND